MSHYITLALVSWFSVFILGFQSRNINSGEYGLAAACSLLIGASNGYVWKAITMDDAGWVDITVYSFAGMGGILSAMRFHKWLVGRR